MSPRACLAFLVGLASIPCLASAHGGTYRGPGCTVPPSSGPGNTGSGSGGSTPATPGASGGSSGASGGAAAPAGPGALGGRTSAPSGPAAPNPASGPDLSAWQLWWGFNQADFLDVKSAVLASEVLPGSDESFLSRGAWVRDRIEPSEEQVRERIVPALRAVLASERDNDVVTGALVALAKIGDAPRVDARSSTRMADLVRPFLADSNQEIAETAAVCLGILGDTGSVPLLVALARDDDAGRALCGKPQGVPLRTRAFAVYGLGLAASRPGDSALSTEIARELFTTLDAGRTLATPDVAVAAVSALGLVPLPVDVDFDARGPAQPWSSRQAAVRRLIELQDDEALHDVIRAHTPVAAARLLEDAALAPLAEHVKDLWSARLARESNLPRGLAWSLVLALGGLADADADPADARARAALLRVARHGRDREVRQFALVALGRAGGRPGTGAEPGAGLEDARLSLLRELLTGRAASRSWAALALGVMGRELLAADQGLSPMVDLALRRALDEARAPGEVGALALALGMRRCKEGAPELLAKLERVADDDARGYVALALGMVGANTALEPIHELVRESKYRPALLRQAAIALGLLGDKALVPELVGMLQRAESLSAQASLAFGLGSIGDARSIEPLVRMLGDESITPRARAFAAVALGFVADEELRPWNARLAIGINYRASTTTLTDGAKAGILDIL